MTTLLIRQFLRMQKPHRMNGASLIYIRNRQIKAGINRKISSTSLQLSNTVNSTQRQRISNKFDTSLKPSDLQKHLEQLKLDVNTFQRVNYKNFRGFVNTIVKDHLSQSEGVFLLNCCTMLPDTSIQQKTELIDTIWSDGIVRCGRPTKEHIISLLRAYKAIGRTIDDFNEFLAKYQCEGDVQLYEEYLYLTCENGKVSEEIVKVLADIKNRGFPLTEPLFNALILGHSKNGNVENCEKVLDTMKSVNLEPTSETYMQLVRAYIGNGDFNKAHDLLNERGESFTHDQIYAVMRTALVNDCVDLSTKAMIFLSENVLYNKHVAPGLRNICIELINMGKSEVAFSIVDNLPVIKFSENEDKDTWGVFFINEMLRHNVNWTKVVSICNKLIGSGRNPRALHCCCEIMLKTNSPNALDCIKLLAQKEPLRPHYFWPLFINQYHSDGEAGVLGVLKEMKMLKVALDQNTLVHYVLTKLPVTMRDTKQGIRILEDNGIPIRLLLTPLLCNLLKQFKVDETLKFLKLHQTKVDSDVLVWPLIINARNLKQNSPIAAFAELVYLIDTRNQNGPCDLAGQILMEVMGNNTIALDGSVLVTILEHFYSSGIKLPTPTCDQLLNHVQKNLNVDVRKKASILLRKLLDKTIEKSSVDQSGQPKHPRDMSLDELECHLIELQSKNLNARGVLRRILQLSVRAGKLERALEVKQLCQEKKVDFSPGMLASILDLMIRTKNLSEAEATLKQLQIMYPAFPVDAFKLVDLASLLIEHDRIEDAKKLLQQHAPSKQKGLPNISKNLWALLSAVTASSVKLASDTNQSKDFLDFLIKLGYCKYDNILLGPGIREYLLKNEVKQAVTEFKTIAETHRKTPMHFELMTTLIEISNGCGRNQSVSIAEAKEMLTQVLNIVASIHGSANATTNLVVAVAKCGTEGQLRKMLIDPNLEINSEMLQKQVNYLSVADGAEMTIIKLAKCSRGLGKLFNEQDLYNLLIDEYIRANNVTAALALFERITEDEEARITKDFTRKIADLLEKNNLQLPSSLLMHLRTA